MNLYRKYRPLEFDQMIGNKEELESLQNTFDKKDRPHVYLLTGESGCGKTTVARICAKKIGAGELSIVEVNSSNNRGIDTARQIIEQCRTYPNDGEYWVFIIDECHQTTKDWQNAMLKLLEDTPEHVYFFLCTTDPQKLLKAFKNRCTSFIFSPLKPTQLYKLLYKVNKAEKGGVDKEVLEEIADNSDGSPRKALVWLEKVFEMGPEKAMKLVSSDLEENSVEVKDLCKCLVNNKSSWGDTVQVIKSIQEDPEQVRRAVLGYANAVLLSGKENRRAALTLEFFSEPFYNMGKSGITLACYQVFFSE